ncbi:MAG: hypothetical protein OXG58_00770 [Gemmatimonadetes bacterium]|nr:hypothetical protein [Gemmatimonadota bacterium]
MTIPDKPTSSRQRYRITAAGRAVLGEVGEMRGVPALSDGGPWRRGERGAGGEGNGV